MRTPDTIPEDVRQRQRAAADPKVSSWLAANAGSGKTHVLAQRVINLLLEDVEPEKILCITFTKRPPPIWPSAYSTRSRPGPRSMTPRSIK